MNPIKLTVEGMSCGGCVKRVAKALEQVSGVSGATVTLENSAAVVQHDGSVKPDQLIAAIEAKGYKAAAV